MDSSVCLYGCLSARTIARSNLINFFYTYYLYVAPQNRKYITYRKSQEDRVTAIGNMHNNLKSSAMLFSSYVSGQTDRQTDKQHHNNNVKTVHLQCHKSILNLLKFDLLCVLCIANNHHCCSITHSTNNFNHCCYRYCHLPGPIN